MQHELVLHGLLDLHQLLACRNKCSCATETPAARSQYYVYPLSYLISTTAFPYLTFYSFEEFRLTEVQENRVWVCLVFVQINF